MFNSFNNKEPKDDSKYQWTNHVKDKMRYYRISESLVKRVVRFPKRIEEGIAPGTTAVMQSRMIGSQSRRQDVEIPTATLEKVWDKPKFGGRRSNQEEIWVMYVEVDAKTKNLMQIGKKKIITAWRYPGVSPVGKRIPIPEDILGELGSLNLTE